MLFEPEQHTSQTQTEHTAYSKYFLLVVHPLTKEVGLQKWWKV
jgi:hypothetical protein